MNIEYYRKAYQVAVRTNRPQKLSNGQVVSPAGRVYRIGKPPVWTKTSVFPTLSLATVPPHKRMPYTKTYQFTVDNPSPRLILVCQLPYTLAVI